MCRVIKVTGESLTPIVEEGDFVLVLKIPFFFLRSGDIIVFRHESHGMMIKLVEVVSRNEGTVFAVGIHPLSTDSRAFGPVPKKDIIGKVIWRVRGRV